MSSSPYLSPCLSLYFDSFTRIGTSNKFNVTLCVTPQTFNSGTETYNAEDIKPGFWISNLSDGQSWLITEITSISDLTYVQVVCEDVEYYNKSISTSSYTDQSQTS